MNDIPGGWTLIKNEIVPVGSRKMPWWPPVEALKQEEKADNHFKEIDDEIRRRPSGWRDGE